MKRCPQCLFIYPDSDARCDFDNTPLVEVDDAELDAATNPQPAPPTKRKRAPRKGRNPLTGGAIKIPRRKTVRFSAGKALKTTIN